MKHLRILSLGAGVHSSTLALMIEHGEIPMVDCAIFSDVGAEPQKVYDWLEYLKSKLSYPVYTVQWRNLKEDVIAAAQGIHKGFTAPYFSINPETGKKGMLRRQCTADYKIKPVTQKVRELLGYKKGERVAKGTRVEMVMGISYDELQRMKTNQIKYIENQYPLVEKKIRRQDCINWLLGNGYPNPPRSACTFCPFHKNSEWQEIKQNKKEWDEVVMIDKLIRHQERHKKNIKNEHQMDQLFLHAERKPIDEIDFRSAEEKGQYSLLDECEGMCGV